jgi:glycine dehydrogenase subunit 2
VKVIFEKSQKGQRAWSLPKNDHEFTKFLPKNGRKSSMELPEISELDLTRHFSNLARRNCGIDTHFYPLGSCTMKLNPRVNEWCASLKGFVQCHPLAPKQFVQGCLEVTHDVLLHLCKIAGMKGGSLVANAGAQGEFVGIQMIAAYHRAKGDTKRNEMIVPDSAHGTNPATAAMCGFKTVSIKTDAHGDMDLEDLKRKVGPQTAGLMLTNPNTCGLFSPVILQFAEIVHKAGGLLYYDGANLNPMLNVCRPGDMGFDVMHINLHKTFSTPHGGGGPGSGPVVASERLLPFLPLPRIVKSGERRGEEYDVIWQDESSIGQVASFFGNFAIYLRAWLYIKLHGDFGLRKVAEQAVLNANYLKTKLDPIIKAPFKQYCMHEFVLQADAFLDKGVRALDIAKRLLDFGVYSPTVYFPLIIKECLLIEPTETESKETLDNFVTIMQTIVNEILEKPNFVKGAPYTTPVGRLDEVQAAKNPRLRFHCSSCERT